MAHLEILQQLGPVIRIRLPSIRDTNHKFTTYWLAIVEYSDNITTSIGAVHGLQVAPLFKAQNRES